MEGMDERILRPCYHLMRDVPILDNIINPNPFFKFNKVEVQLSTIMISPWIKKGKCLDFINPNPYFKFNKVEVKLSTIMISPWIEKENVWN
jgi:hypothetical protein